MKIAFLGGSFNPVHVGHLALADAVHAELGYDLVILVPANIPPHKELSSGATAADRLAMLALAVEGKDYLAVDGCEIERGGVSYTIDTVGYLSAKYGRPLEGKLALVIGEDLVDGFDKWKDVPGLVERTDIVVARRPGGSASPFAHPHIQLENSLMPVSSSDIRERIAARKSWRYLVPEPVYGYIVSHTLYEYRTN